MMQNHMCKLVLWLVLALFLSSSRAGVMTREALIRHFPSPLIIAEKDSTLPIWPIFKQNATENELVGYVFESVDMAPIPGFSGIPVNLLIALDPKGTFLDVSVISQHEPVFLDGLGPVPLTQFVSQYHGLSINQNIKIGTRHGDKTSDTYAFIDGVTKATASVRIINQSILASALKVARKKLGFAQTRDPDLIARMKTDVFEAHTVPELLKQDLIRHVVLYNRDIEKQFAGTDGAGLDQDALDHPDAVFIDLYLAYVSIPSVGRNLLQPYSWKKLTGRLDTGDHAILAMSTGRYAIMGDDFVRGSVPNRLLLRQDKLPIEIRDLDMDLSLVKNTLIAPDASIGVFRIISQSGLDPSQALEFSLPVTRSKGVVYPERITRDIVISMQVPARFYHAAQADNKSWQGSWTGRWKELAVLLSALIILSVALIRQRSLTRHEGRFIWFRRVYLLFTLFFVGWYAQGQLSIVNITGLLQAVIAGRNLSFFLYDPMTVILWGFVLISLVVWGRGTFCGWLCPFGALQEFIGKLAKVMRIPQIKIKSGTNAKLKYVKYGVLAGILASLFFSNEITDKLVELEPFKTAITLGFVRSWPYLIYAIGLLIASATVYKFFCRYLCPFGAGLAVLGRVRVFDWLPRRKECGIPCQTCRHRCDYQAIAPGGEIVYADCFQCMDCVVIYESDQKCAPLLLEQKKNRVIPIQSLPVTP